MIFPGNLVILNRDSQKHELCWGAPAFAKNSLGKSGVVVCRFHNSSFGFVLSVFEAVSNADAEEALVFVDGNVGWISTRHLQVIR